MSRVLHLIYPHRQAIACPDAIGRRLADRLRQDYDVRQYNWNDTGIIHPGRGDILLGHPHPAPWTIFRRSVRQPGWARTLAIFPYSHGDGLQAAFAESSVRSVDRVLAISGNYWSKRIEESLFSHWGPKLIFLDLAVDRRDFPRIKAAFNPPGARKLLYIGNSSWVKNVPYLTAIALRLGANSISWIGDGRPISGLRPLGYHDFSSEEAQQLVAEHDFLITVSRSDANPATILESMSWGLIPICTPQSGYERTAGIINVPLDDPDGAAAVLHSLQHAPESYLKDLRRKNDQALEEHFTWERFTEEVAAAVSSHDAPVLLPTSLGRRSRIAFNALTSRYSPLRPPNLRLLAGRVAGARRL